MAGETLSGLQVRRVLVGQDRSTLGGPALRYAAGLARWYSCPLFVIVVEPPAPMWGIGLPPVDPERLAPYWTDQVRDALRYVADGADGADGAALDVRVAVMRGDRIAVLERLADRPDDCLVHAASAPDRPVRGERRRFAHRRAATLSV